MSRRANDGLPTMLFVGVLLMLAVWAMDDLRASTRTWFGATTHVACPPPAPLEQLHVVHYWAGERLQARCLYIGARGDHSRRMVRTAEASK